MKKKTNRLVNTVALSKRNNLYIFFIAKFTLLGNK